MGDRLDMPIRLAQVPAGWDVLSGENMNPGGLKARGVRDKLRLEQGDAPKRDKNMQTITDAAKAGKWNSYALFAEIKDDYERVSAQVGGGRSKGKITYSDCVVLSIRIVSPDSLRLVCATAADEKFEVVVDSRAGLRIWQVAGNVEFENPPMTPSAR